MPDVAGARGTVLAIPPAVESGGVAEDQSAWRPCRITRCAAGICRSTSPSGGYGIPNWPLQGNTYSQGPSDWLPVRNLSVVFGVALPAL
jgi:hypothetical protein